VERHPAHQVGVLNPPLIVASQRKASIPNAISPRSSVIDGYSWENQDFAPTSTIGYMNPMEFERQAGLAWAGVNQTACRPIGRSHLAERGAVKLNVTAERHTELFNIFGIYSTAFLSECPW
jgi:hypothetical protein